MKTSGYDRRTQTKAISTILITLLGLVLFAFQRGSPQFACPTFGCLN